MAAGKILTMKLLVDSQTNKVLFAEAEKEVIDFLLGLMVLPVGSLVELVTKKNMAGCMGNLYESIEKMRDTYIQPSLVKNSSLRPKAVLSSITVASTGVKYYGCANTYDTYHNYITTSYGAKCPMCGYRMRTEMCYVNGETIGEDGYVKEGVTYIVTDDLIVMPMSTISVIAILQKFNVESIRSIEEKNVSFGMEEGLELLKASLKSNTALTEVFHANKMPHVA